MKALLLVLALGAAAQPPAPSGLDAPFRAETPLAAGFRAYLEGRGCRLEGKAVLKDGKALTVGEVEALRRDFEALPTWTAGGTGGDQAPVLALPSAAAGLAAFGGDAKGGGAGVVQVPDKEDPKPIPQPEPPKPPRKRGLRVMGIELGGSSETRPQGGEPYAPKGSDRFLDWDIRLRLPVDGIGLRTVYRNPQAIRSLSLTGLKYWDWPGAINSEARDDAYGSVGLTPTRVKGGFQLGASGSLDAYWGASASYDDKEAVAGSRWYRNRVASLTGSYSPLGDNPGKPWNISLLAMPFFQRLERRDARVDDDRAGVGAAASFVFQRALDKVPMPWLREIPIVGHGLLRPDRLKTTTTATQSQLSTLALRQTVELSVYLGRYLQVTPGVWAQWRPDPNESDPDERKTDWGALLGLDLNNLPF